MYDDRVEWETTDDAKVEIDVFVTDLIKLMQSAHKKFAAHEARVSADLKKKPDRHRLRRLVKERVRTRWGDDEMLPLIVRVIVDGDFAF